MAITAPAVLEVNDNDTDQGSVTPYETGMLTPTASTPGFVCIFASRNPLSATPTVAQTGTLALGDLTAVATVSFHTAGTPVRRGYLWWYPGTASPGSGTLTFTFAADQQNLAWHVIEVPGMDTTDPVAAFINTATDSATNITSTLDDTGGTVSWDATIAFGGLGANTTLAAGSGFSAIATTISTSPNLRTSSEYILSKVTTANFTAGASGNGGVLAVGVVAAATGGVVGQSTALRQALSRRRRR